MVEKIEQSDYIQLINTLLYKYPQPVHSPIEGHFSWFQVLAL